VFRLYGGPMHGHYVTLEDNATQLKVVMPVTERTKVYGQDDHERVVETRTEFYVNTGFAGRLDYQPHPH
jgi:hypothetical protein